MQKCSTKFYYCCNEGDEDSEEEEEEDDDEEGGEDDAKEGEDDPQNPTLKNLYAGKFVSLFLSSFYHRDVVTSELGG